MAATEGALGALHQLVAKVLAERIANGELCTAADLNAAIKFLKDNNITSTREANEHLDELQKAVESHSGTDAADDEDLQRALDEITSWQGGVNAGIG